MLPPMKRHILLFPTLLLMIFLSMLQGCSDKKNELWASIPSRAEEFLTEYFSNRALSSVSRGTDGSYIVDIQKGPQVQFSKSGDWNSVEGRGETLPAQFIFDCFPPELYSYLENMESVNEVYGVWRHNGQYDVSTINSTLHYDDVSGVNVI